MWTRLLFLIGSALLISSTWAESLESDGEASVQNGTLRGHYPPTSRNKCLRDGGTCASTSKCDTLLIYRNDPYKNCNRKKGKKQLCCAKHKKWHCPVRRNRMCKNKGGFCVKKTRACKHGRISGKCKCRFNKKGYCCMPKRAEAGCHFPFRYKGDTFTKCTKIESPGWPWCSTNKYGWDKNWRYCVIDTYCQFPFVYKGKKYNRCTFKDSDIDKPWCSTNGNGHDDNWKYCDRESECHFPFDYKGVTYTECTDVDADRPWCDINNNGDWKYCGKAPALYPPPPPPPAPPGK